VSPSALMKLVSASRSIAPDLIQGWMYHGNLAATIRGSRTVPTAAPCLGRSQLALRAGQREALDRAPHRRQRAALAHRGRHRLRLAHEPRSAPVLRFRGRLPALHSERIRLPQAAPRPGLSLGNPAISRHRRGGGDDRSSRSLPPHQRSRGGCASRLRRPAVPVPTSTSCSPAGT